MRQGHRGTPQGRGQLPPAHDCWGPSPSRVPELPRRERAELEADPDAATQKRTTSTWTDLGVGRWHVIEGRKTFGLLMYVGRRVSVGDGGCRCAGGGVAWPWAHRYAKHRGWKGPQHTDHPFLSSFKPERKGTRLP